MSMLERAVKKGLSKAVGNAVGQAASNALGNAVQRKVGDAVAQPLNDAANQLSPPPDPVQTQQAQTSAAQLGGIFAGFAGAAQSYANEAAKNMKICSSCGEAAGADQTFCPHCGARLPEMTAAQGAVCQGCGQQNDVGTKFCAGCGAKLPAALAGEEAARAKNEAELSKWESLLPQYPIWVLGGDEIQIEEYGLENGCPAYGLHISGAGLPGLLAQYSQILKQNGFVTAGQYPMESMLYKRVDGVVYCFSSDNAFDGGTDHMSLYFSVREPSGGFDYVKPEPRQKPKGWKDLLGL
ncbi:MAG: zinc ribbon domain-containing protein [Oscillospiraceae bacterium]|nr:zinc ribbon domain-containing protein [Oscillospiraceae bacterium]